MEKLDKFLHITDGIGLKIGILFLISIGTLTLVNVVTRFFGLAVKGFFEIIESLMIITALVSMMTAAFEKGQVAVDVLVMKLSKRNRAIFAIIASVASFLFWTSVTLATIFWFIRIGYSEATDVLGIPLIVFYIPWILGLIILVLILIREIYLDYKQVKS